MLAARLTNAAVLRPGTKLGKYELIKQLAIGGMAEIFLARARGIEQFEKLVVLKRILPQYASSAEFVTMFLDEARLVATLQHANIAQVYDIGEDKGCLFFTMEFINGEDARCLLKRVVNDRRRLPLEHALTILIGAAAGLHSAHEKRGSNGEPLNIVHRDVSPANVLISFDGCVKLIDFGVAKGAQRQTETLAGTLKGKIAYMAPEQCRGESVDRRADLFALGILLYELTTSRKLFRGNEFSMMRQITEKDVRPPSRIRSTYPAELEAIVMRALARDRNKRYSTAQQIQLDLERFARNHGLVLSGVKLGEYMRDLFAPKVEAWTQLEQKLRSPEARRPPTHLPELQIVYEQEYDCAHKREHPRDEDYEDLEINDASDESSLQAIPEMLAAAPPSHSVSIATQLGPNWRRRGLGAVCTLATAAIALVSLMWLGSGDISQVSTAAPPPVVMVQETSPEPAAHAPVPRQPTHTVAATKPKAKKPTKLRRRTTKARTRPRKRTTRKWNRDSALPP